jgi:aryl-alcohol dehydrogenase-like predicted oxidoreductase
MTLDTRQSSRPVLERRVCGAAGPVLSVLGLGCWQFGGGAYWGPSDQDEVNRIVHAAVDGGISYFDTAELYNEGRSEQFLGTALKGIPRDRVIVGTKVWPTHLHPKTLREHCEASLRRLGMEYVDIYMIHWPLNPRTYSSFADVSKQGVSGGTGDAATVPLLEDVVNTLLRLQAEGKVRHLGLSNYGAARLQEIRDVGGVYVIDQVVYNLVTRAAEFDLLPYCTGTGTGIMTYMTLMQGLLTDRYRTLDEMPDWYTRTRHFNCRRNPKTRHGEPGVEDRLLQSLSGIRAVAQEYGCSMADLALRWVIAQPSVTCALIGTHSPKSLQANLKAAAAPLSPDIVARLDAVTQPLKEALGPSLDIFESTANDRTR